jgi:hypothetical protein
MPGFGRVVRTAGVASAVVLLLGGCAESVTGTPVPQGFGAGHSSDYASLLTECDVVAPDRIAEIVGGETIERGFLGAICRWTVSGATGPARVTFNWFETGTLEVEKRTSDRLGYEVEDITVGGRRAVLSRPPADPASCGVTAGFPAGGVVGWWVQYRAGGGADPCAAASALVESTLNLAA